MEWASEIVKENPVMMVLVGFCFIVGMFFKLYKDVYEFKENSFLKRKIKRLEGLSGEVVKDGLYSKFLDKLKDEEVFSISTGYITSPVKAKALINLYLEGVIPAKDIKNFGGFLEVGDNGDLCIKIGKLEFFLIYYSLASGVAAICLSLILLYILTDIAGVVGLYLGLLSVIVIGCIAFFLFSEYFTFKRFVNTFSDLTVPGFNKKWKESPLGTVKRLVRRRECD
ncbi:hypothetical protein ONV78_29135 [Hahella sp. CR1]|uniref:hypothetical protein n=1 Tax=Hahella sp. CR1 TaxID=2992807 RepID=UPI002441B795|nr:hypothetical protein [Hahella sp. CR1]MDG9671836.1 hypothetical protein [Hahella sp. CR1]